MALLMRRPAGLVDRAKRVAQCPGRAVQHRDNRLPDKGIPRVTAPRTPPGKAHRDRTIPTQCLRERKDPDQLTSKESRVHLDLVRADRRVLVIPVVPVVPEDRRAVADIKSLGLGGAHECSPFKSSAFAAERRIGRGAFPYAVWSRLPCSSPHYQIHSNSFLIMS